MANILVLHGPNLNLLGTREPEQYGTTTLAALNKALDEAGQQLGHTLSIFQSHSENELINEIHESSTRATEFILFNPAAFTHTSIALRDALLAVAIPFVEIHLSNIYRRETFRHHSYFSDIALGVISGLGTQGYMAGLHYADHYLSNPHNVRSIAPSWTCEKLKS